jgi:hypothetical protein
MSAVAMPRNFTKTRSSDENNCKTRRIFIVIVFNKPITENSPVLSVAILMSYLNRKIAFFLYTNFIP